MDQNQKQQAVEQLRNATTVLVTTSSNPTVDQIAASLGLSKFLQKLDKNVTTVITSSVPTSLQFLNIEKELDDNLDSLRDFIVSLDKNLADKLRYKVEGDEVRIFITPYRAQIKKEDIRFSQGDFNVDAVVVVGTLNRTEIDEAVLAQSRVLNETPVISVTAGPSQSNIGGINWHDPGASSVSEMIVSVSEALQPGLLDNVSSNILLTGIIAATDHFSNPDTSPKVMTMAAQLMAAGADQQTIMRELKGSFSNSAPVAAKSIAKQDGSDGSVELKEEKDEVVKLTDDKATTNDNSDIKIEHINSTEDTQESPVKSVEETAKVTPDPIAPLIDEKPAEVVGDVPEAITPPAPVAQATEAPIAPVATATAPVPAVSAQPADESVAQLDEARAAVEAAVSAQPAGTALNPVASLGTQELTPEVQLAGSTNVSQSVAPQLGDVPSLDTSSNTGAVAGSVNPAQLYPEVQSPYDQQQ